MPPGGSPWPPPWHTGPYDPNLPYNNPTMSVPTDAYLRAYYRSTPYQLQFQAPGLYAEYLGAPTNVVARAIWKTPIFDFRPDLLNSMGPQQSSATPIRGGQTFGGGITLAIMPTYTPPGTPLNPVQVNVYTLEYAHLSDPTKIQRINDVQDVTEDFFDPINATFTTPPYSMTLTASAPAGVRYWRCAVIVDIITNDLQVLDFPVSIESTCW